MFRQTLMIWWEINQLVCSTTRCLQTRLSILDSHACTRVVASLNVTLIQPNIELPVMHWRRHRSIRWTYTTVQAPQSQPFLTCACDLWWWTTWEPHLWESIPAAALTRSALRRSTLILFLPWRHLFSVTFTLVLCWMWSSSAYQVVTGSHYSWTVQSLCLKMPESPLEKSNHLHFQLRHAQQLFGYVYYTWAWF